MDNFESEDLKQRQKNYQETAWRQRWYTSAAIVAAVASPIAYFVGGKYGGGIMIAVISIVTFSIWKGNRPPGVPAYPSRHSGAPPVQRRNSKELRPQDMNLKGVRPAAAVEYQRQAKSSREMLREDTTNLHKLVLELGRPKQMLQIWPGQRDFQHWSAYMNTITNITTGGRLRLIVMDATTQTIDQMEGPAPPHMVPFRIQMVWSSARNMSNPLWQMTHKDKGMTVAVFSRHWQQWDGNRYVTIHKLDDPVIEQRGGIATTLRHRAPVGAMTISLYLDDSKDDLVDVKPSELSGHRGGVQNLLGGSGDLNVKPSITFDPSAAFNATPNRSRQGSGVSPRASATMPGQTIFGRSPGASLQGLFSTTNSTTAGLAPRGLGPMSTPTRGGLGRDTLSGDAFLPRQSNLATPARHSTGATVPLSPPRGLGTPVPMGRASAVTPPQQQVEENFDEQN